MLERKYVYWFVTIFALILVAGFVLGQLFQSSSLPAPEKFLPTVQFPDSITPEAIQNITFINNTEIPETEPLIRMMNSTQQYEVSLICEDNPLTGSCQNRIFVQDKETSQTFEIAGIPFHISEDVQIIWINAKELAIEWSETSTAGWRIIVDVANQIIVEAVRITLESV